MSKLQELINELCPNGVEYVKIKHTFTRLRGTPITAGKMKDISNENGNITVVAGGKTIINANEEDIPNANIIKVPSVLVQSRGVIDVMYFEKPFTFKNEMWAYTHKEKATVKYLYYVLKNNLDYFRNSASGMGSLPQISLPVTEEFEISLPPLPVQEEIVRILDNFTELTAELTARKKQYEYYRDSILENNDYPSKQLGELCKFVRGPFGGALKKECFQEGGFAVYEQQHAIYGKFEFRYYVSEDKFNELKRFEVFPNDLIMSCSGTMGKIAIIPSNSPRGIINQALLKLSANNHVDVKYLKYCFESTIAKQMNDNARGGAIKNVASVDVLKKIEVKLPPLSEQQRIVDILDRFDTLCNDISNGLPAEIKARQLQQFYF